MNSLGGEVDFSRFWSATSICVFVSEQSMLRIAGMIYSFLTFPQNKCYIQINLPERRPPFLNVSIIFNPNAGANNLHRQLEQAARFLQARGWSITWGETAYPGHATVLARQAAARNMDMVIAAGGDGTVNEVMNGLVRTDTALGVIPAGTGNVFAADMRIPLPGPLPHQNLLRAAHVLLKSKPRRIDVGKATFANGESRYFLLWAGIGLDAAVSKAVQADKKKRPTMRWLGMVTWLISASFVLRDFRGARMRLSLDGETINRRVIMTAINNSQLYGRFWRLAPGAKIDDGWLDVVVMAGYGFRSSLKHIALATLGRLAEDPETILYRTKHIKIETKRPIPVHLDAENVGFTPVQIDIAPRSLIVYLPTNAPSNLFSQGNE